MDSHERISENSDSTILVVDDELTSRQVLEAMLESSGYRAVGVSTGEEAVEIVNVERPDLVLLDVIMPGMSGFEVCHHLRSDPYLSEIPVLLVTGLEDQESRIKGFEAGADDVITKPIDVRELRARVNTIIRLNRYRQLLDERERNISLLADLQHSHFELALAYDSTLEGWVRALDLRDKETEGHTQRVTDLTMKLAREYGIEQEHLVHIYRGALLHDIGKIGIPDSILHKEGPLTTEERETMRQHPVYAYEMLSHIDYLRQALSIPYCHHEKWDGSGYPRGLRGEEIPLSARVFAVADVWDALVYDRKYRKKWPPEKVMKHISDLSGSHFDPYVVDVFLQMRRRNGSH